MLLLEYRVIDTEENKMKYYLELTKNGINTIVDEVFSSSLEASDAGNLYVNEGKADSFSYFIEDIKKSKEEKGAIQ